MKNIQLKSSVYIIVCISAIIWCVLAWISNIELSTITAFLSLIPKVVSVDLLLIMIFTKWGWRIKIFKSWLVPFPNLNGSWVGTIRSDWVNPETGKNITPIPVLLTIRQSFFNISCKMITGEMESISMSEGFHIEVERQIKQLAYLYTSRPRISVQERSLPHDGALVFNIIEKPEKKLVGRYWTERKTTGEVSVKFHGNVLLEELPSNIGEHPLQELR